MPILSDEEIARIEGEIASTPVPQAEVQGEIAPVPEKKDPERGQLDMARDAFSIDNVMVGLARNAVRPQFKEVDGYNPWRDEMLLGGEGHQELINRNASRFMEAVSPEHAFSMLAEIQQREKEKMRLQDDGWGGTAWQLAAAISDPTVLLPGGQIYRSTRLGQSMLRSGASVGAMAAGATAVQETILQQSDQSRTALESGVAIGGAAALGGLLGGALAGLSGRSAARIARELDGQAPARAHVNVPGRERLEWRDEVGASAGPRVVSDADALAFERAGKVESFRTQSGVAYKVDDDGVAAREVADGETPAIAPARTVFVDAADAPALKVEGARVAVSGDTIRILAPDETGKFVETGAVAARAEPDVGRVPVELVDEATDVVGAPSALSRADVGDEISEVARYPEPAANTNMPASGAQSAGAAAVAGADTTLKPGFLGLGAALSKLSSVVSPLQTLQNSGFNSGRLLAGIAADPGGTRIGANTRAGGFQTVAPDGTIQVRAQVEIDRINNNFANDVNEIYFDYFRETQGGGKVKASLASARADMGIGPAGLRSNTQLRTDAINNWRVAGKSDDPWEQKIIAAYNRAMKETSDILKAAGYEIPEGDPKFAKGYANRIYRKDAVLARAPELEELVYWSMRQKQEVDQLLQGQIKAEQDALTAIQDEQSKVASRLATAQMRRVEAEARAQELDRVSTFAQRRLESADARVAEIDNSIATLDGELSQAIEAKTWTKGEVIAAQEELRSLRADRERVLRASKEPPPAAPTGYASQTAFEQRLAAATRELETADGEIKDILSDAVGPDPVKIAAAADRALAAGRADIALTAAARAEEIAAAAGKATPRGFRKGTKEYLAEQSRLAAQSKRYSEIAAAVREKAGPETLKDIRGYTPPDTFSDDTNPRRFFEYLTGKRGAPREPSIIEWMIAGGGVRDDGGEIANAYRRAGREVPRGLIRSDADSVDKWALSYGEKVSRSDENWEDALLDHIVSTANDTNFRPPEWRDGYAPELRARIDEYEAAQQVRKDMEAAGLNSSDRSSAIAFMRGEDPNGLAGKPAGEDFFDESIPLDPVEVYRAADEVTAVKQGELKRAERIVATIKKRIQAKETTEARAAGRQGEAENTVRRVSSRLDTLLDRAEFYAARDQELAGKLEELSKNQAATREKLEALVVKWEGATADEARKMLDKRAKLLEERQAKIARGEYQGHGGPLKMADETVDQTIKRIIAKPTDLSDAELRAQARDVVGNLSSTPTGRVPYEWGSTAAKEARMLAMASKSADTPKYLLERVFPLTDEQLISLGVVETDPAALLYAYTNSMVMKAEWGRVFKNADGSPDPSGAAGIRAIKEEADQFIANAESIRRDELIAAGKSEEEAAKQAALEAPGLRQQIGKQRDRDIGAFEQMRDMMLGVYKLPDNPDGMLARSASVAKNAMYLSNMGTVVLSQIADMGGNIARHGLGATFSGIADALNRYKPEAVTKAQREWIKDMALGSEMVTANRAMAMSDIMTDYGRGNMFERGLQKAAAGFSVINGQRPWDDFARPLAANIAIRRAMRGIEQWVTKGDIDDATGEWLAAHGINQNVARRIWAAATAEGSEGQRWKGVLMPEGRTWQGKEGREAYDLMRFAMRQATDNQIIKPGMEVPGVMSGPVGGVMLQFKRFFIASQQRILIAGLQQADANVMQGFFSTFAMGMATVALYDLARNGQIKQRSHEEWAVEAFDRSGLGGWLTEVNNTAEKGFGVGLRPLAGAEPSARYASRSFAEALVGPALGAAWNLQQAARNLNTEDGMNRGDIRNVVRMVPGQNWLPIRRGVDAIVDAIGDGLDKPAREKPEGAELGDALTGMGAGLAIGAAGVAAATVGAAGAVAVASPLMRRAARRQLKLVRDERGRIVGADGADRFTVRRNARDEAIGLEPVQ